MSLFHSKLMFDFQKVIVAIWDPLSVAGMVKVDTCSTSQHLNMDLLL